MEQTRPATILVVDDDAHNRNLLEALIEAEGHLAHGVASGEEALATVAQQLPDLILLDIMMPGIDGYEVTRRLKTDARTRAIPVVLVTAMEDRESRLKGLEAGAEEFLSKPVDRAELLIRVRNLLKVKEYQDFLANHNRILEEQVQQRTASLKESEKKYRALTEVTSDWVWEVDAKGAYTYSSPKVRDLLGYEPEEVLGKTPFDFMSAAEAHRVGLVFQRLAELPQPFSSLENENLHKDGRRVILETSGVPVIDDAGNFLGYRGIDRDITERRLAEEALCTSEERYHQLFENMGSGVAIYQPDAACETFTFKSVNQAAERIDQVRREELLGKNLEQVFPGVRDLGLLEVFQRVCRGGSPERLPAALYRDERISGWRENFVYGLDSGEIVAVYDDVSERVERETQIKRLNGALRTLSACNMALVHARSEEELFQSVCRHIVETGGYLLAWVEYPDEGEGNTPHFGAHFGAHFGDEAAFLRHADLAREPGHADHCLTAIAQRERLPKFCNKLHGLPDCGFDILHEAGVGAILALPLCHSETFYGALTVYAVEEDAFGAAEIKLAEELAGDLAFGIAMLRTRAERDQGNANLRQVLEQTIAAIALTLEKRDPYTAGHQLRVAEIATAIATEMGLPPQQVEGIHFGSLIHDIGKIAVPAEILAKPAKLSGIEYMMIQTHSEVGFDIVKDIPFPWPVAQMVYQHHERMDGSGYPRQLKGEEIMLEARILAVADVLEAMAAHRPYRAALGMEAALKELERGRGTAFDPVVVDACLRWRERGQTPSLPLAGESWREG